MVFRTSVCKRFTERGYLFKVTEGAKGCVNAIKKRTERMGKQIL